MVDLLKPEGGQSKKNTLNNTLNAPNLDSVDDSCGSFVCLMKNTAALSLVSLYSWNNTKGTKTLMIKKAQKIINIPFRQSNKHGVYLDF